MKTEYWKFNAKVLSSQPDLPLFHAVATTISVAIGNLFSNLSPKVNFEENFHNPLHQNTMKQTDKTFDNFPSYGVYLWNRHRQFYFGRKSVCCYSSKGGQQG